MADLIAPHGGLTEPVCRTVAHADIAAFESEAASLPQIPVSAADLSSVYRFGDGTLSPLTERQKDEKPVSISGKDVRAKLVANEHVAPRIMRPSTSNILGEAMKGK